MKELLIDFAKHAIDFENFDIEFSPEQLVDDYLSKAPKCKHGNNKYVGKLLQCDSCGKIYKA